MNSRIVQSKLWLKLIIAFGIIIAVILFFGFASKSCNKTVGFSVGSVDPQFKISQEEAKEVAKDAANRLNSQSGQQLLAYDQSGPVRINLIYDERQAEIDRLQREADKLNSGQNQVENSNAQLEILIKQFEARLAAYNQEVASWNKKGGAPSAVYQRLQSESQQLETMKNQIENLSNTLNSKVADYNSEVARFNDQIESKNNLVITQGLYYPKNDKIDIFTFGNKEELRLVLMHEMGHALGLEHAASEKSIMYYLLTKQSSVDPLLSAEDKTMVENRCKISNKNFFLNMFKRFRNVLQ